MPNIRIRQKLKNVPHCDVEPEDRVICQGDGARPPALCRDRRLSLILDEGREADCAVLGYLLDVSVDQFGYVAWHDHQQFGWVDLEKYALEVL